jgi:glutamate-ammonia-ligase adenylyltransferase
LAEAKPGGGGWDAKFGPGRLMDIELLAQTLALQAAVPARQVERQIALGAKRPNMSQVDQAALVDAYRLCWRLQCAARLLSDRTTSPDALGEGGRAFVLRECGATAPEALTERLKEAAALAERVIVAHLDG